MRGKVDGIGYDLPDAGITPACAGKSAKPAQPLLPVRDHPRVCGEKCGYILDLLGGVGSPPRVRGKAFLAGAHIYHYRITPACAGKRRQPDDCKRSI